MEWQDKSEYLYIVIHRDKEVNILACRRYFIWNKNAGPFAETSMKYWFQLKVGQKS